MNKDIERRLDRLEAGAGGIDPLSLLSDEELEARIEAERAHYDPDTWAALVAEAKAIARRS